MGIQREFDLTVVPIKGEIDAPSLPRKNLRLSVVEPNIKDETSSQEVDMILTQYLETLSQRKKFHIGKRHIVVTPSGGAIFGEGWSGAHPSSEYYVGYRGYPTNMFYEHHAALAPLLQFSLNNCGDPFTGSPVDFHSKDFELAVLDWFAQLWEIEKGEYWGYITNGGTEGNLHGLLVGRELLPSGIIYASTDSHYSIFKAARMYRMEIETINTLVNGEIDCADLRSKLLLNQHKPAIININIGTIFKGAIDDLDLVIQTLEKCGYPNDRYYIHCDAALCGLIVPFIKHGKTITFKKPMGSISVSGHKFLGCPVPCGIQITRKSYISSLSEIEYIASTDVTISGSRNGLAPIFLWYNLSMKGHARLQQDAKMCIENARYLKNRLLKAGISAMLNEFSTTVVFERPCDHKFIRRWQLCYLNGMAHVVVMPGITRETIDSFFKDLMQERKNRGGTTLSPCLANDIGSQNCLCSYQNMHC